MKKVFWFALIFWLAIPFCVYAFDGSGFDADDDGDIDAADLADFVQYYGALRWYKDFDGDRYSDGNILYATAQPIDYYLESELTSTIGDCNDKDPTVNPEVEETCDNIDNNCDGRIDEGLHVSDPSSLPGHDFTDTFPSNYSVGSYPSQKNGSATGALSPEGDVDWFHVYAVEDLSDLCFTDDDDAPIVAQVTLTGASDKWYEVCVCWSTSDTLCNKDVSQSLQCVTSEGGTTVDVIAEMKMSCKNTDAGYLDIQIKPNNPEIDFSCEYYNVSWNVWEQ